MRPNLSFAAIIAVSFVFAASAADATPSSTFTLRGFGMQADCIAGHVRVSYPLHTISLTSVKRLNATECQVTGTIDASSDTILASGPAPSGFAPAGFTFSIDNVGEPSIVDNVVTVATPSPTPRPQFTFDPSAHYQFAPIVVITSPPTADPGSSSGSGTGQGPGTITCSKQNSGISAAPLSGCGSLSQIGTVTIPLGGSSGTSAMSSAAAQKIALDHVHGTVTASYPTFYKQSNVMRSEFLFRIQTTSGATQFVGVDAVTGDIVQDFR